MCMSLDLRSRPSQAVSLECAVDEASQKPALGCIKTPATV